MGDTTEAETVPESVHVEVVAYAKVSPGSAGDTVQLVDVSVDADAVRVAVTAVEKANVAGRGKLLPDQTRPSTEKRNARG